jgi:hypothetical protein
MRRAPSAETASSAAARIDVDGRGRTAWRVEAAVRPLARSRRRLRARADVGTGSASTGGGVTITRSAVGPRHDGAHDFPATNGRNHDGVSIHPGGT